MKKIITFSILVCLIILNGCTATSVEESPTISTNETTENQHTMQIQIASDNTVIIYELNDSTAAKSLYEQLPLTLEVQDYSDNEKIFYPPSPLDISDAPLAQGPAGTLAYYEPWGDVVMFYKESNGSNGLYALGKATTSIEDLKNLTGILHITKYENVSN